ncbi:MAG TPA: hypothetical protein VJ861_11830 [Treponemataceae bacterium]|nr:hypothetical protein [Treponemataceae bacterium]
MIEKILVGYASLFKTLIRVLMLASVCFATGMLIVWPLWKLADSYPDMYTIVFTTFFSVIIIWIVGSRILISYKKDSRAFLFSFLRKLTIICGIFLIIILILSWHRSLAFIVLGATLALYGFLAFVVSPDKAKG